MKIQNLICKINQPSDCLVHDMLLCAVIRFRNISPDKLWIILHKSRQALISDIRSVRIYLSCQFISL